jgi:hypothetical protein
MAMRKSGGRFTARFVILFAIVAACGPNQLWVVTDQSRTPPSEIAAYQLDCGPVVSSICEQIAYAVVSLEAARNPGSRVVKLSFTTADLDYEVRLDDGRTVSGRYAEP